MIFCFCFSLAPKLYRILHNSQQKSSSSQVSYPSGRAAHHASRPGQTLIKPLDRRLIGGPVGEINRALLPKHTRYRTFTDTLQLPDNMTQVIPRNHLEKGPR